METSRNYCTNFAITDHIIHRKLHAGIIHKVTYFLVILVNSAVKQK